MWLSSALTLLPGTCVFAALMQSTSNPDDPLLQSLRAQGLLMPPQRCTIFSGPTVALLPPQIEPVAPLWTATDTASFINALSQATTIYTQPNRLVSGSMAAYWLHPRVHQD